MVTVMTVQYALLDTLHEQPRPRLWLKQAFDRCCPRSGPLPFGQVYASLSRLERGGRVAVDGVARVEGPDHQRYASRGGRTDLGRGWASRSTRSHTRRPSCT